MTEFEEHLRARLRHDAGTLPESNTEMAAVTRRGRRHALTTRFGAAAVVVASGEAIDRFGIDRGRAVRVLSSATRSERLYGPGEGIDAALTAETAGLAFERASIDPRDVDVLEVHDAFSIEELLYTEALGFCGPGEAASLVQSGEFDIGGRCAISPSGGLLSMGHPIGPTGAGQVAEITRQLRGEAGPRQQPGARLGMAHMVGVGAVCVVHVLAGPGVVA